MRKGALPFGVRKNPASQIIISWGLCTLFSALVSTTRRVTKLSKGLKWFRADDPGTATLINRQIQQLGLRL
jgi:hypothetical protein